MKYRTVILFLFFCTYSNAQLLVTRTPDISTGPMTFNAMLIRQAKIRSITIASVDKPDGAIIIDKGATEGYEFDTIGRVSRYYYTVLSNVTKQEVDVPAVKHRGRIIRPATTKTVTRYLNDTIFTNLFYDGLNRVICKRSRTGDYYDAWYYEYDGQGNVIKEMHCRETNASENKNEFRLGVQTILSTETFKYEQLAPAQIRKLCFNDEGREYKKAIINYDTHGNKISESYNFTVSWMHQENSWKYDAAGRLAEFTTSGNESGEVKNRFVYEYDKNGVVQTIRKFRNTELILEMNYLYDETHTFVKSEANRDHQHASIEIVKYSYSYY